MLSFTSISESGVACDLYADLLVFMKSYIFQNVVHRREALILFYPLALTLVRAPTDPPLMSTFMHPSPHPSLFLILSSTPVKGARFHITTPLLIISHLLVACAEMRAVSCSQADLCELQKKR